MLPTVRQRAICHPPQSFLSFVPTRSIHSTSQAEQKSTRQRLAREKAAERYEKIVRKRSIKDMREERLAAKQERAFAEEQRRHQEIKEKQVASQQITQNLDPFTEDQLESMYRGLIAARTEELALGAIEQAKAPALPDPHAESAEREHRLIRLSERLDELEPAQANADDAGVQEKTLTDRLRKKREGVADEVVQYAKEDEVLELEKVSTPAVSLLSRVERLAQDQTLVTRSPSRAVGLAASLPKGLLARSEWIDLVLSCAEEGNTKAVIRALQSMEATVPLADGKVLEDILQIYASEGRPQDAVKLTDFARSHSLPLSVTAHHHLLTSLLPSHPELAVRHLHSMEALGYTPLPATYNSVVSRLLSPFSTPALIRKGWDLYAHSRLVSHPIPSVELYSTMIQACARGSNPSPERAIDLFTEMMDDNRLPASELAFNGVIRSCAREGSQEYYFEALRYMRRMLDENVEPSKHTFHALLEGAKRHGDLARSRWMLVKMVGVGGKVKPDANTLGLVFQSYASYKSEGSKRREKMNVTKEVASASSDRPSLILKPEHDPAQITSSSATSPTMNDEEAGPLALIELLGEASLFYPGPLPQTSAQVLEEAQNLMAQIVPPSALDLPASDDPVLKARSMFPDVQPSTFLLNAYLSVLNSHSSLIASCDFFEKAFAMSAVQKNRYSFELIMKRCELGKVGSEVIERGKKVFEEWNRWSQEACPDVEELRQRVSKGEAADHMEVQRVAMIGKDWEKARKNGKNIAKMWGGLIRILAKGHREDEALTVLRRFVELYPPANVANYRPSFSPVPGPDKSITRVPIQLSSSLYPETAPTLTPSLPPHLVFDDLKVLHLRFANMEDKLGLAYVKGVSKAYEAGLAHFKNWESKTRLA